MININPDLFDVIQHIMYYDPRRDIFCIDRRSLELFNNKTNENYVTICSALKALENQGAGY